MDPRLVARDTATVVAVGVLAATLAAICHETLGHGLSCIASGGHITLLTSIWFRCQGGAAITDAGGPLGNLVAGIAALVLLGHAKPGPRARLFMLMFGALNLFWFTAQLALDAIKGIDDWGYSALGMHWPALWQPVGAIAGIGGYLLVGRWVAALIRKQSSPQEATVRLAYIAAAASAVIAGLMWAPAPLRSAWEGFLTLGVAPLGLLFAARKTERERPHDAGRDAVPRSWWWISISTVIFVLFLLVQAGGLSSMARSMLPS